LDKQAIGDRIKTLRQKKRLSQQALVERARAYIPTGRVLNRESISHYENGKTWPDVWVVSAIAQALGVSFEYLQGEPERSVMSPEPELWEITRKLNRQPPHVRELAAKLIEAAMTYGGALAEVSLRSGGGHGGETSAQVLASWAEQSVDALALQSWLHNNQSQDATIADILRFVAGESAPADDNESHEVGRQNGQ
jgi:transcriptional regulator with XRE-family HTH domain